MQRALSAEAIRLGNAIRDGQSVKKVKAAVRALVAKNRKGLDEPINEEGFPALHLAGIMSRIDLVTLFLQEGSSPNILNPADGSTALMTACYFRDADLTLKLLSGGAEVDTPSCDGTTALGVASSDGNMALVHVLLSAAASVDLADNDGITPLLFASENGHHEVVQQLLSAGADPNHVDVKNVRGHTPLFGAVSEGQHRVTQLLLTSGADATKADSSGYSPLFLASQNGQNIIVEQLIAAGADLERSNGEEGRTALTSASAVGHRSTVRKLLRAGAQVNAIYRNPFGAIHLASMNGHAHVVEELISGGADVQMLTTHGVRGMDLAAMGGHREVIRKLMSAGADANSVGICSAGPPLLIAARHGQSGVALELLSGGASLTKALTAARVDDDDGIDVAAIELLLAADRQHFASQSALDLMRGTDLLFGKEGRLKVSQREVSPEVLQEVAEEMA